MNALGINKRIPFKFEVASRTPTEIQLEKGRKKFIRGAKSSNGTFPNHVRLCPANWASRPFQLREGDILQLGLIIRVGRGWVTLKRRLRRSGRPARSRPSAMFSPPFFFFLRVVVLMRIVKMPKNLATVVGPATSLAIPGANIEGSTSNAQSYKF